jgi:hypothetical protein
MDKIKQTLKNDHYNHLAHQLEQFEKIAPVAKSGPEPAFTSSSYETLILDTVTFAYVRGYN